MIKNLSETLRENFLSQNVAMYSKTVFVFGRIFLFHIPLFVLFRGSHASDHTTDHNFVTVTSNIYHWVIELAVRYLSNLRKSVDWSWKAFPEVR